MKYNFVRLTLCYLLIMIILLSFAPASFAEENNIKKIRVGHIELSSFHNNFISGTDDGYGDEYLQEIAKYTGWEYENIHTTWEQGLKMLEEGSIDIVGAIPYSEEYIKRFDYPILESGISYTTLCINILDREIAYNDFEAFDGMTVGILEGSSLYKNLIKFSTINNFSINPVFYPNQPALLNALHYNKVDAILISNLEVRPTEKVISQFEPTPFYFITTKGNKEVLDQLNFAQGQIKTNNPYFDSDLFKKHYDIQGKNVKPVFTMEEQRYISNSDIINAVYDPAWAPIEFYDENTNTFSGITSDIFKLISDTSGLKFNFIKTNSFSESLNIIKNGGADILCGFGNEKKWSEKQNITLSNPYFSSSIFLV